MKTREELAHKIFCASVAGGEVWPMSDVVAAVDAMHTACVNRWPGDFPTAMLRREQAAAPAATAWPAASGKDREDGWYYDWDFLAEVRESFMANDCGDIGSDQIDNVCHALAVLGYAPEIKR